MPSLLAELARQRSWPRVLWERVYGILFVDEHDYTALWEFLLGIGTILYGGVFLLPYDTLHSTPGYQTMLDLGIPENVYGLFYVGAGIVSVVSVVSVVFDLKADRRVGAVLNLGVWMFTFLCFTRSAYVFFENTHKINHSVVIFGGIVCLWYVLCHRIRAS